MVHQQNGKILITGAEIQQKHDNENISDPSVYCTHNPDACQWKPVRIHFRRPESPDRTEPNRTNRPMCRELIGMENRLRIKTLIDQRR